MRRGVLVGIVAVVLAACGGDDEPDVAVADPVVATDDGGDSGDSGAAGESGDADVGDDAAGSADSGGGIADPISACGLLTLDDVASRGVDAASGPTQVEGDFGFDQCTFEDELGVAVMYVSVFPPSDGQGGVSDAEQISGLGSSAYYSPSGRSISVGLSDGSSVSMSIALASPPEDPRQALIELAEVAIG